MTVCPLTPCQIDVIALVADGKTNEEIAIVLGISASAVARRIDRAWHVTFTFNRTQLACKALREGWIR